MEPAAARTRTYEFDLRAAARTPAVGKEGAPPLLLINPDAAAHTHRALRPSPTRQGDQKSQMW